MAAGLSRRFSAKSCGFVSHTRFLFSHESIESPRLGPDWPSNVLIVSKSTRYEWESKKENRIPNDPSIVESHNWHSWNVQKIAHAFQRAGRKSEIVKDGEYWDKDLSHFDLIVSAGGDGTFLRTSSRVLASTPIFGVNTDPARSAGYLCSFALHSGEDFSKIVNRLIDRHFEPLIRQRIRITAKAMSPKLANDISMIDAPPPMREPNAGSLGSWSALALNEVLIAESEAATASYFDLKVDDGKFERHKSSGLLVCTGTGSTAWTINACRIPPEEVIKVCKAVGVPTTKQKAWEITQQLEKDTIFPPTSNQLHFFVREPVINQLYSATRVRGMCSKITVLPRLLRGGIVVDSQKKGPILTPGYKLTMEIDPSAALWTICFQN